MATIGQGEEGPGWAKNVLESRDRTKGGIAAPAHGLTLTNVVYPDRYDLPIARQREIGDEHFRRQFSFMMPTYELV
jgi:tRNA pseudouridine38-40 synthase